MKVGRRRLVAGNWKMNGSLAANERLLDALKAGLKPVAGLEFAVFAPFPYLAAISSLLSGSFIGWGAQDVSEHDVGAYTGEVSGSMLREFGCRYVLVGHSERRQLFGEVDMQVAAKFAAAQRHGLIPILCVGETLEQRELGATEVVVGRQLDAVLDLTGIVALKNAVVAYEPVWAIGTGKNASPDQAQAVHAFIRERLALRSKEIADAVTLLYGGSVKASNAAELFTQPDVDGGLIGGASLIADDFLAICKSAENA